MAKVILRERLSDTKVYFNAHYGKVWVGEQIVRAKSGKAVLVHFQGDIDGVAYNFEKWVPYTWRKSVAADNSSECFDLPWGSQLIDKYTKVIL